MVKLRKVKDLGQVTSITNRQGKVVQRKVYELTETETVVSKSVVNTEIFAMMREACVKQRDELSQKIIAIDEMLAGMDDI